MVSAFYHGNPLLNVIPKKVSYFSKAFHQGTLLAVFRCRIGNLPGEAMDIHGIMSASFISVSVPEGDGEVKTFVLQKKVKDLAGFMSRDSDADFFHDLYGEAVDRPGFQTGAFGLKAFSEKMVDPGRRHGASGVVMQAHEQDAGFFVFEKHRAPLGERDE